MPRSRTFVLVWGLALAFVFPALAQEPAAAAEAPPAAEPQPGEAAAEPVAAREPVGGRAAEPTAAQEPAAEPIAAPEPTPGPASAPPPSRAVEDAPVTVTTRLRPDPSYVGDVLEFEIVAAYPRGVTVNLPSGLSLAPLHWVDASESPAEVTGEGLRKTFTIRLQHFAPGSATVPSFPLTYVLPDGQVHTLDVPAQAFTVDSLLANVSDPQRKEEDPPISLAYPNLLAETIVYSAAATLSLIALLLPFLLKWMRREKVVPLPPPVPPHERARRALDALEQGELLEHGRFQDFYVQLTEVAKEYLEGRFGVPALDHTTEEIRRTLVHRPERVAPLRADEVIAFLQRCDLVKFARFEPARDEALGAVVEVRTMVDQATVSAPPAPPRSEEEARA